MIKLMLITADEQTVVEAQSAGVDRIFTIGGAQAIGPVIQGLAKPFNDLSRGCSVEDVINVACICAILA